MNFYGHHIGKCKMKIVYQSSDSFCMMAGISIISLFENNKDIDILDIVILDAGISERNKSKIKQIGKSYNRDINFVEINTYINRIKGYGLKEYNGSCAMYMKFFLDECFHEDEKILYLDCDTIIIDKLKELWEWNLNGKCMGMAIDCMNSELKKGFGLSKNTIYYNTGVILFDLAQWRKDQCKDIFIRYVKNHPYDFPFVDQDIINICLNDKISTLPMKFNCISLYEKFSSDEIKYMYKLNSRTFYSKEEFERDKKSPVIIHFPTVYFSRPWYKDCTLNWAKYFDIYLYKSPWRMYNKVSSQYKIISKMQRFLYTCLPKVLYIRLQRLLSSFYNKKLSKKIMRYS